MLFNSYIFIFAFLPVVLVIYYILRGHIGYEWACAWIVLASLFFYSWWKPIYLLLLLTSIGVNFGFAKILATCRLTPVRARLILALGVGFNICIIGYYKYAGFFVQNVDTLFDANFVIPQIILPIGISFITFQKIAFLVDAYHGEVKRLSLPNYMFFVSFFPQLIAGPIVHHREIIPQLEDPAPRDRTADIAVGLSIFCVGLFKKVVVADTCAIYGDAGYDTLKGGHPLDPASAALAVLAFSFQIYYDFSAYSDMAIGLARMFGFLLPVNFFSPYRATGFVEFWRRWHITLSRFLRDYLYIPLGGNRKGPARQSLNLVAVMLLGGLWHGANWTFVAWGVVHGAMLGINHGWSRTRFSRHPWFSLPLSRGFFAAVTFFLVTLAWILFRSPTFSQAHQMLANVFPVGPGGWGALVHSYRAFFDAQFGSAQQLLDLASWIKPKELWPPVLPPDFLATSRPVGLWLLAVAIGTFLFPNTCQVFARFDPALGLAYFRMSRFGVLSRLDWAAAFAFAGIFVLSLLQLNHVTPFYYFQF
jgi:alginate O-acetyltransferase complex protein AlgI